jgi:hypothetical protein
MKQFFALLKELVLLFPQDATQVNAASAEVSLLAERFIFLRAKINVV